MIHDPILIDKLSEFEEIRFEGSVFRATRKSLDPLASSTNAGRWMMKGVASVLYTSLTFEGAMAELCYHWGHWSPRPSKPATISEIAVGIESSIKLVKADLTQLGITDAEFDEPNYVNMQKVGAACSFLEIEGLIVPNARWKTDNLILFSDNLKSIDSIDLVKSEDVDWIEWGTKHDILSK